MTHQPKPGPDFSGQNLSGRSFRGQNLRRAVFRSADLRSVDFRETDLTEADFSGARMGKTRRRWLWELLVGYMTESGLIIFFTVAFAIGHWAGVWVVAVVIGVVIGVKVVFEHWWRSRQGLQNEIPKLDGLPELDRLNRLIDLDLRFRCSGGTDFRDANLTGAVFSGANLAYVRFAGATLNRTHWLNAKNLHLANTYGTVLQAKPIRELMTTGKTQHKDFHGLDLHGLDFSGFILAEADFTDCNLTGASFKGADLTAAAIGHWNIDKFTLFEGIVCEYVYLDKKRKDRHPATGQFRPGEFAKLYQEIAHTVDFLIENREQMEALRQAMEKLRASYDDENIAKAQKFERKGEAYKVSVEVPAELEDILRKELREEYDLQLQLLEHQHQAKLLQKDLQHLQHVNEILSSQRDDEKRMLDRVIDALNRPTTIHNTFEAKAMNDHSRKIENSPIINSAVNLGDHAVVNNAPQIANQMAEIGPLLEQLRGLIGQSNELPEVLKQDALEKVETLSLAATQAEAKSTAAGALESLKTTAKVATGISTVVLALSKLFGF